LPGLSGFVAEMTIFVGSFQHVDVFRRVLTIVACCSIVITAVYILRTIGKILYGPVQDEHHIGLPDAHWYEKVSVVCLIIAIAFIGMYPAGASGIIQDSLVPIMTQLK
jgi:NADH-quinone oxidoreductase subunit M